MVCLCLRPKFQSYNIDCVILYHGVVALVAAAAVRIGARRADGQTDVGSSFILTTIESRVNHGYKIQQTNILAE